MNRFLEFHFAIKVRMDFPAQLHLHPPEFWGSEKRTEIEMNNLLLWAPLALKAIYGSEIVPIQLCQQSQLLPLAILVIGMGQMPRWHKLLFELLEKLWVWMFWIDNWNVFINLKIFFFYIILQRRAFERINVLKVQLNTFSLIRTIWMVLGPGLPIHHLCMHIALLH